VFGRGDLGSYFEPLPTFRLDDLPAFFEKFNTPSA
jgi:hypothetical protein